MSETTGRRERGSGTVERVGDRWRFRSPNGVGGRYTSPLEYASDVEALRGLAVYRKKIIAGEITPLDGMTLARYVEDVWLPRMERQRPLSVKTYRSNWNSQISKARFADRPLRALRRKDIRRWVDTMEIDHPEHPFSVLRSILSAAVEDEHIDFSVAQGMRIERTRREDTTPTPEEQAAIVNCEEIPLVVRQIALFASGLALRPKEWRLLELRDVHHDAPAPFIFIRHTKGRRTRRVPLFGQSLRAVTQWLPMLPAWCPANPRGLLFPREDGKPHRSAEPFGTIRGENAWVVYLRRAGVRETIRLHDLRHAGATDLLEGKRGGAWSPREIQDLLGHQSVTTTERTYLHATEPRSFAAAGRLVQNGPEEVTKAPETRGPAPISRLSLSSFRPASSGAESPVYAGIAPGWDDAGLIAELRDGIWKLKSGRFSAEKARSLVGRVIAARREADRIELAAKRMDGDHWKAAFAEIVELLIPGAEVPRKKPRPATESR